MILTTYGDRNLYNGYANDRYPLSREFSQKAFYVFTLKGKTLLD